MQPLKVVRIFDPAFSNDDGAASSVAEYAQTRDFDKVAPLLRPGAVPVIFHVQGAKRSAWTLIRDTPGEGAQVQAAFRHCVKRVENYPGLGPVWTPSGASMTEDELDLFAIADLEEIGAVAFQETHLPKVPGRRFRPSPLSLSAWVATASARQSADQSPEAAPPSNEKP